ncbi:MAG: TetR/AcrR family transcriptional regulator [Acidimicrobiia bacterium]|nr:TetR family transcriptional regulator [Acidimicrobiia bacterium]NNF10734.1 TetR/AcrR family transcriptional regulator [Acidimicrobiia bacterium]NNL68398.1 TetR/AcrR family transcriptional regulator [Acidimicrobiia bacterium]
MSPARPPGRRPGDADVTRHQILEAARATFAEAGFERATMRAIAGRAGVDPALIHHHFGAKESLFAAAHRLPDPRAALEPILTGPAPGMGERLARFYLQLATTPDSPVVSLFRAAATNDAAARMLREFIEHGLLGTAEDVLPYDRPRLRLALCATHLIGVVFGRSIVAVPEMTEPDVEELVALLAPALERYLTEPL